MCFDGKFTLANQKFHGECGECYFHPCLRIKSFKFISLNFLLIFYE